MSGPKSWPRPLRLGLAVLFALATTLYSAIWMYGARRTPSASLRIDFTHSRSEGAVRVLSVGPGGAADRAGLRPGDVIRSIDGEPLDTALPLGDLLYRSRPGDQARLVVERKEAPDPLAFDVVLDAPRRDAQPLSRRLVEELLGSYPVLFLIVAVAVLLLRLDDPSAWRLALLFAGFIAGAPYFAARTPRALHPFGSAYQLLFDGTSAGLFLYFFSVFPTASPIDRRLPWLKSLWLGAGLVVAVPLALSALLTGTTGPIEASIHRAGLPSDWPLIIYYFGGFGLGFVSLVASALGAPAAARRKSRVIVWGTLAGFGPAFLMFAAGVYLGKDPYQFPFWVWAPCVLTLSLIPLSFAYAVARHRVLELPVLLQRSARYLLVQRGFIGLLLLLGTGATLFFALSFARYLGSQRQALAIGLGAGFGTVLVWTGTEVQRRVRERIDRAFFRRAYDARHVLEELAEQARAATSREALAALLEHHVGNALQPASLVVYVECRDGSLQLLRGSAPPDVQTLPASLPPLADLARRGAPREVNAADEDSREILSLLASLAPDCLVPILGRGSRLTGLLVLGARLSEQPYSGEDKRLLASVANQAGIALDGIRLAEQIAERLEVERRAAHEMELAKQVQSKLLPQRPPVLATVECAGRCLQARAVGGDYFDFLDLGAGRLGLALADVSGKGFPAALLMASLQASLRSRLAHELLDLPRSLCSVNELLYRTSETNRFATLFLGIYDDASRRLTYANCGHNPPLILRADGSLDRLPPTGPAVGLLEDWECETAEVRLEAGDILVLFSDGVTEAWSDDGVEFGEGRLIELLSRLRELSPSALVDAVLATVREFSGSEQEDDQTMVVARVR